MKEAKAIDGDLGEVQYTMGDRLLDKLEELKGSNREVLDQIQKLMYYVIVIGALNGTVSVGKIVESATSTSSNLQEKGLAEHVRSQNPSIDSREKGPSDG